MSGHASQTTKKVPNENTAPASSAPPKRMPSARPSRKVPNAATNSFSTAMTASDFQNGSTYAGHVNGEKTADCAFATNGRPAMMCGFHSGMCGSASRTYWKKGWNTVTASAVSKFAPPHRTPDGAESVHGAVLHSMSELDSARPGRRPCPTKTSESTA